MQMRELTLRAVLLGLVMTVILGAANAYLGLRAGITIAATYPAAVISMAVLRAWKGSLLEENIARTSGSIGEVVAAGAIFTIPAFLMLTRWPSFGFARRVLEIHRAHDGRQRVGRAFHLAGAPRHGGGSGAALSRIGRRLGNSQGRPARRGGRQDICSGISVSAASIFLLGRFGLFAADAEFSFPIGELGASRVRLGGAGTTNVLPPAASPPSRRPASAPPTWASATSSGRGWPRCSSPAA